MRDWRPARGDDLGTLILLFVIVFGAARLALFFAYGV